MYYVYLEGKGLIVENISKENIRDKKHFIPTIHARPRPQDSLGMVHHVQDHHRNRQPHGQEEQPPPFRHLRRLCGEENGMAAVGRGEVRTQNRYSSRCSTPLMSAYLEVALLLGVLVPQDRSTTWPEWCVLARYGCRLEEERVEFTLNWRVSTGGRERGGGARPLDTSKNKWTFPTCRKNTLCVYSI